METEIKAYPLCILEKAPGADTKCKKTADCTRCGWNIKEAARRHKYLRKHGLTLCADGLYRLIIEAAPDDGARQKGTVQNEK